MSDELRVAPDGRVVLRLPDTSPRPLWVILHGGRRPWIGALFDDAAVRDWPRASDEGVVSRETRGRHVGGGA